MKKSFAPTAPRNEGTIQLKDGRTLGYAEFGASDGMPVFYCHGFPSSRLEAGIGSAAALAHGLRLIAPDRPGFGLSDAAPQRTLLDWPQDLRQLADHLRIGRFAVLGVSGGGPYALACLTALSERISAAGLVAPLGPLDEEMGQRAMQPFFRLTFFLATRFPILTTFLYGQLLVPLLRRCPTLLLPLLRTSHPDMPVVRRPAIRAAMIASIREAFRRGGRGAAQELILYTRSWGFSLRDIGLPVHLWYAGQDVTVPPVIGKALCERISGCQPHYCPDEGHFSLAYAHAGEFFRVLHQAIIRASSLSDYP
ncbi:alpha/beta fold hydrolase [Geoalkalibacter halelectricus]|uniref:Alpha/beta hydrolase n=1 Tax=Geoalkalibacter halelectricus TaxID=2847045 RepID=A0ABY5ZJS5_9BACT|nr:alpha/beta hydrolase [Geoalkalibacter halelectricus]MDO3380248.1 alpha/beta hydrolase [Geoalkalibacter halelectricus]UWZ78185.1 alpha/beta hydrolase [Geoalkalibacter halelectricus]